MRGIDLLVAKALSEPWAILPRRGRAIVGILARRYAGKILPPEAIEAAVGADIEAREARIAAMGGGAAPAVAVFPVYGVLVNRAYEVDNVSGGGMVSAEKLGAALRRADADAAISTIVLDIDSPGGSVCGMPELAAVVAGLEKPVVAVANGLAASAAYWLASQADEVVVSPSGEVGSIGVYTLHEDWSRAMEAEGVTVTPISSGPAKVDGLPYFPLSDTARADAQGKVDAFYGMFVGDVAKGRGVTKATAKADFGEGRTMLAKDALAAGMVDRIATLEETVARLAAGGRVKPRRAAISEDGETLAAAPGIVGEIEIEIPEGVAAAAIAGATMDLVAATVEAHPDLRCVVERGADGKSVTVRAAPDHAAAPPGMSADLAELDLLAGAETPRSMGLPSATSPDTKP